MSSPSSDLDLAGELGQLQDHELGRLEWRETDDDIDDSAIYVILGGRLAVALDEVGVTRRGALERALAEERLHEGADVEPDLHPQRLVVRLEHHPLSAAEQAFFYKKG